MTDTIKIGCRIPQGLKLRVSDWLDDPANPGQKMLREVEVIDMAGSGAHVAAPGASGEPAFTDVPADLWTKWMAMNGESDLVKSGALFKDGEDPKADDQPKAPEPAPQPAAAPVPAAQAKPAPKAPRS